MDRKYSKKFSGISRDGRLNYFMRSSILGINITPPTTNENNVEISTLAAERSLMFLIFIFLFRSLRSAILSIEEFISSVENTNEMAKAIKSH